MGILSTGLFLAGFSSACADPAPSLSVPVEPTRHPVIGNKPARELLNADLLALPESERLAWVHGAAVMAAQIVAADRPVLAGCLNDAFAGEGNASEKLLEVMKLYPEEPATATVYAIARIACPTLATE